MKHTETGAQLPTTYSEDFKASIFCRLKAVVASGTHRGQCWAQVRERGPLAAAEVICYTSAPMVPLLL